MGIADLAGPAIVALAEGFAYPAELNAQLLQAWRAQPPGYVPRTRYMCGERAILAILGTVYLFSNNRLSCDLGFLWAQAQIFLHHNLAV